MIEKIIDDKLVTGRVDKYIMRMLPGMSKGLLYKQLRNKNITLNGKKITGNEQISPGDVLRFYLSDETIDKFAGGIDAKSGKKGVDSDDIAAYIYAYDSLSDKVSVVYENEHIIIMDKPSDMLSQKSSKDDISLNEWMLGYLLKTETVKDADLIHYKPSVLNRLDRNTTGLVIGAKTYEAANIISRALKDRTIHKYYRTYVWGECKLKDGIYEAYLSKDSLTNTVNILTNSVNINDQVCRDDIDSNYGESDKSNNGNSIATAIRTGIRCIDKYDIGECGSISALEIELITGKSHQIRAHLAHLGYPITGDPKYGNTAKDKALKRAINGPDGESLLKAHPFLAGCTDHQALQSYKIIFPDDICKCLNIDRKQISI